MIPTHYNRLGVGSNESTTTESTSTESTSTESTTTDTTVPWGGPGYYCCLAHLYAGTDCSGEILETVPQPLYASTLERFTEFTSCEIDSNYIPERSWRNVIQSGPHASEDDAMADCGI